MVGVTTNLNIRDVPSLDGNIVEKLKNGNSLKVTGYTSDGWLQVSTSKTAVGYASAEYVNVPVVSLTAKVSSQQVVVGSTGQVVMTIFPACASNLKMSWTSSDTKVGTVSSSGVVSGKTVGTVTVTAKTADGGKKASTKVSVVPVAVSGVSVSPSQASVAVGATTTLKATVAPSDAADKSVSWTSSDTKVATVSSSGVVTGKAGGAVTVTVKTADGGKTASAKVTVTVAVAGVSVSGPGSVVVGKTVTLKAAVSPSDASDKSVSWASSDTSVATVSSSGVVSGKTVGTATITVKTSDGGKTAQVKVEVVAAPIVVTGVSVSPSQVSVAVGATTALKASVAPADATDTSVSWASANQKVATVSSSGVVSGKTVGATTITVKTSDGGKTAQVKVTVTPVQVVRVSVSPVSVKMAVGATTALKVAVLPESASNKNVSWASSNQKVATVSSSGVVTGKTVGTATITVKTVDGGKTAQVRVTVTAVKPVASLSLSGSMSIPDPLKQGSPVTVKGTVSSGSLLTNVTAKITTSSGTVKYSMSTDPKKYKFDTNNWDNKLLFSKLGVGDYKYVVSGKDASGVSKTLRSTAFSVAGASKLSLTGSMSIPNPLKPGTAVTVKGVVSSNWPLTSVTAKIVTSTGTVKYSAAADPKPDKKFYTNTWDSKLLFSKLLAGSYVYVVTGKDAGGGSKILRSTPFKVGAGTPAKSVLTLTGSMKIPDPLTPGHPVSVTGMVKSSLYPLANVTAKISAGSVVKYTQSINPGSTSFNTARWDNKLLFSKLLPGTYTYTVSAKDNQGTTKILRNTTFKVGTGTGTSLTLTGVSVPKKLTQGVGVTVKGTVKSTPAKLKTVSASITGTPYSASVDLKNKNVNQFNLAQWDSKLKFSKLTGTTSGKKYSYVIKASDQNGKSKTWTWTITVTKPDTPKKITTGDNKAVNTQLPGKGTGYVAYNSGSNRWGTKRTIASIQAVGKEWAKKGWGLLSIGDISRKGGGKMSGHASHQKGVDYDIRPIRTDGKAEPVTIYSSKYSRSRTRALIKVILATGNVKMIFFNDPVLIQEFPKVHHWAGHDNHLHVRYQQ